MLLGMFEELRQPRCAAVQRYVRRKREVITIPHGPGQRRHDWLLRTQCVCHQSEEMDDDILCTTYLAVVKLYGFYAREALQDWWVTWGRSIFNLLPESEDEDSDSDDEVDSDEIVVGADVERDGLGYPILSDHLMGEDDDVVRESGAHRRGQR